MSLEELINEFYEKLNDNDLHVLKYILNNKKTCSQMGINDLAEACHSSRSSIHRMTKKLNFSGYSEFRVFLKWEEQPELMRGTHVEILENDVTTTFKNLAAVDFDPISEKLYSANRIFIYGTGTAQLSCVMEAQRLFALMSTFITVIHDETEFETMLKAMQEDDVVIILSLSGSTPALMPIVKQLNARGIDFISITNLKNNKLAQMSPYSIYAATSETFAGDGTEVVSFIPFYIAVETMFRKYADYVEKQ
ncbi:MurR/RpiR family transcriptional regulator [Salipaludibacillus aurantiacus]|uniref:RpiR family transcriptional regulator, glv operon transcriptional regulator n=1 Tax=Salipaludibacillus aurantiacus TaxID=1601833 RepID=A0A1H9S9H2_9BACI|nr:MurR/RpiR family transcriptional regulator [Salipaludibacillus aurantiacus]SER81642.1 RpiR family transcriptional regulator, glv operon transcriptional regulator [Salipaludibacillus aurantiacus]